MGFQSAVANTLLDVRKTFYEILLNKAQIEVREQSVTLLEQQLLDAQSRFNVMLETSFTSAQSVISSGRTDWSNSVFLSPGIRWSYNFPSGLQIVPGIAVPIGVGPSAGEKGVFLYLSFEHPMWREKK